MLLPLTEILGLTQKQNEKNYVVAPDCNPNGIVQQKPSGHSLSSLFSTLSYTISLSLFLSRTVLFTPETLPFARFIYRHQQN